VELARRAADSTVIERNGRQRNRTGDGVIVVVRAVGDEVIELRGRGEDGQGDRAVHVVIIRLQLGLQDVGRVAAQLEGQRNQVDDRCAHGGLSVPCVFA